jgi:DNA-binding transcriptional regulator YhcF (GntR family)
LKEREKRILEAVNSQIELLRQEEEQRDKEPSLEYKSHIFKNPQTVRNCLSKLEKLGFITKEGKNRKKIFLSENLKIQILGNIVLDYKVICLDTKKI